jgi:2-amino-4-hydroxy-6-hydroxymethyldihydropteridine diphosphokinase
VAVGRTYIGFGSNLGDPEFQIEQALCDLGKRSVEIGKVSSLYHTEPVDAPTDGWFLNCVACVRSEFSPYELLRVCQSIEFAQGRERKLDHGPRTIDLDLLLMGSLILSRTELTLPHPRLHLRRFVLVPLAEIAPELIHPKLKLNAQEMLSHCNDTSAVVRAGTLVPR